MSTVIGIVIIAAVICGGYFLWKSGWITSSEDKPKDTASEDNPNE